jgi:hypothetical protein
MAVEEQSAIGWNNFIKGRVSKKWSEAQDIFYKSVHPTSPLTGEQWSSKLITEVWKIFFSVWKARNTHLHCPPGNEPSAHLNKRIQHAYSRLRHSIAKSDSLLFSLSLHERLNTSAAAKLVWLDSVGIAEHDFSIIHRRSPTQRTIPDMFQTIINNQQLNSQQDHDTFATADTWNHIDAWEGPDFI